MTSDNLSALIARLEAATGPDRELDALIVAGLNNALLKPYPPATDFGPQAKWQFWSLDGEHFLGNESKFKVLPYTASIDAALTLVDPGAGVYLNRYWLREGEAWSVTLASGITRANDTSVEDAPSAPLALCIASLRARMTATAPTGEHTTS